MYSETRLYVTYYDTLYQEHIALYIARIKSKIDIYKEKF